MSAKDLGTGKEQKIEIKAGSGLSDDEIKSMVADAEAHAEDDRKARELAEARNDAENAAYQAERQLKDLGDQVDHASKTEIEAAIKDVRESLTSPRTRTRSTPRPRRCRPPSTRSPRPCTRSAQQQAARRRPTARRRTARPPADGGASAEEDVVDAEVVDEGK